MRHIVDYYVNSAYLNLQNSFLCAVQKVYSFEDIQGESLSLLSTGNF